MSLYILLSIDIFMWLINLISYVSMTYYDLTVQVLLYNVHLYASGYHTLSSFIAHLKIFIWCSRLCRQVSFGLVHFPQIYKSCLCDLYACIWPAGWLELPGTGSHSDYVRFHTLFRKQDLDFNDLQSWRYPLLIIIGFIGFDDSH